MTEGDGWMEFLAGGWIPDHRVFSRYPDTPEAVTSVCNCPVSITERLPESARSAGS